MRTLSQLDYSIILVYLVIIFIVGIGLTKKASESIEDFFVGGRSMNFWLVGVSMAATNFSIDTPIAVSNYIWKEGISGVWFLWASAISAVFVTFFFSKLWSRSQVLTDAEIIEVRYSGKAAKFLRLLKGIYFGVIFNAFIMGWVFLSLRKVLSGVTDLNITMVMVGTVLLVFVYSVASGFYGVVLTDFVQYFLALIGSIILAFLSLKEVGGVQNLVIEINKSAEINNSVLNFIPSFSEDSLMPFSVFLVYISVQWWAHKYADGGGKHIQRLLSAKDEKHAFLGSALYTFLTYALQVWPWIITSLCSLIVLKGIGDPEMSYPMMMAKVLPHGLFGFVVVCLIGAFMSTIDTHLNLGASYIVNDIYKRFLAPDKDAKHYVFVSRIMMGVLLILAVIISQNLESVGSAWKFLLTFASGAGLTWIMRWFWWRVNAYSEISAMITSGVVATYLNFQHSTLIYTDKLLITVAISTIVWVSITFLTSPSNQERLEDFVQKVKPAKFGWAHIYDSLSIQEIGSLKASLWQVFFGLIAFFTLNFSIGNYIFEDYGLGTTLLAVSMVSTFIIIKIQKHSIDQN